MDFSMEETHSEPIPLQVSVIIVTHNQIEPLRRCLGALEHSKPRESFEVLVVDNGSRDGCESIDSEFPQITVLRLPRHFGLTKARNIGIRTAKGEHLFFLSPEVQVEPATIAALTAKLGQESAALAVCPLLVDENGTPQSELRRLPDPAGVSRHWRTGLPAEGVAQDKDEDTPVELPDSRALLIRRQSVQAINYLDERFGESWSDCDLAFQIRRAGRRILVAGSIRAKVLPSEPSKMDGARLAAFEADRAVGAAAFVGKHFGFLSGISLRLKITLGALLRMEFGLLQRVFSGQKIDGNDPTL
jgi:GT2 family glycosyltransferase